MQDPENVHERHETRRGLVVAKLLRMIFRYSFLNRSRVFGLIAIFKRITGPVTQLQGGKNCRMGQLAKSAVSRPDGGCEAEGVGNDHRRRLELALMFSVFLPTLLTAVFKAGNLAATFQNLDAMMWPIPWYQTISRPDHVRPADSMTRNPAVRRVESTARFARSWISDWLASPSKLYSAVGKWYVLPSPDVMNRENPSSSIDS